MSRSAEPSSPSRLLPELRFEEVFESAPDATLVVDASGEIVLANARSQQLFGYSRGELVGQEIEVLLPQRLRERHREYRNRFLAAPEIRPMGIGSELHARRKDGTEIPIDISLSPLNRDEGPFVLCAVRDITYLRQTERRIREQAESLARANEKLERSNEELNDFAGVLAHDLQAPLRHLTQFSDLLVSDAGDDLSDAARKDLQYIKSAAKQMGELIRELLEFARAGDQEVYKQEISLQECVEQVLTIFSTPIQEAKAEILVDELPKVRADASMLKQVFQNLIGNALKFVGDSKPELHITAEEREDDTLLGVKDNGIGIDPRFAGEIFSPFRRLHGSAEYEGTGIGLATCHKIIERHGGHIWVESEPGAGAHFRFTIPRN